MLKSKHLFTEWVQSRSKFKQANFGYILNIIINFYLANQEKINNSHNSNFIIVCLTYLNCLRPKLPKRQVHQQTINDESRDPTAIITLSVNMENLLHRRINNYSDKQNIMI